MTTLWHYTCDHGALGLGDTGTLMPAVAQLEQAPTLPLDALPLLYMCWATDMDPPDREALGLTQWTHDCDRMRHRYRVPTGAFRHWGRVRSKLPAPLVDALELARGAQPARWWVAFEPVPGVHRDATWMGE